MLVTSPLELPAELRNRRLTGRVYVYGRHKHELLNGGFVLEPSADPIPLHVPMHWTGKCGLSLLWRAWVESHGITGYRPMGNAYHVCDGVDYTLHLIVEWAG